MSTLNQRIKEGRFRNKIKYGFSNWTIEGGYGNYNIEVLNDIIISCSVFTHMLVGKKAYNHMKYYYENNMILELRERE